ncbi:ABC transporter permease [Arsenicicoccus sp. oral taxon 190]|uniref:ABC transporter permease n=1 Tax=Arsenicicoccus sp. oral taxon 190 TaxID=1658671 RepID=UPI00067A117A|nr:ABC transporter permease [Arsenicicoccus sp. oral taxon 190]AKT52223.1 ABC transporter permease [Arsenicicoccus sp. oral taxon 190]
MRRWLADHLVPIVAGLVLAYLFVPIAYVVVFSFNTYTRSNVAWSGRPTLDHWRRPCAAPGVCEALGTSLQVGLAATVVATVLGTMLALALARSRFRGRGFVDLLVLLPMATPEVVLGASLLTIFVQGFARLGLELGWWTIVLSHVMFALSFVVVTVRARLQSLDPRLEEAAADLYAGPQATFWRVTLPAILPGVVGAALLSFALSFDDVIITSFVSGEVQTFPTYVYAAYLRGIPAEANVIGVIMLLVAVTCAVAARLLGGRSSLTGR